MEKIRITPALVNQTVELFRNPPQEVCELPTLQDSSLVYAYSPEVAAAGVILDQVSPDEKIEIKPLQRLARQIGKLVRKSIPEEELQAIIKERVRATNELREIRHEQSRQRSLVTYH